MNISPIIDLAKNIILLLFPFLGPDNFEFGIGLVLIIAGILTWSIKYLLKQLK